MEHLRTIHVYLTGDVITPESPCEPGEADPVNCECTFVYGEACEHGYGATLESGWIDDRWSRFVPHESRDDVDPARTVDVLETVADGQDPAAAIAEAVTDAIGVIDHCDGRGTYYAADEDRDYRSGESVSLAAHLKDARGEDLPDDLVAAVDAYLARPRADMSTLAARLDRAAEAIASSGIDCPRSRIADACAEAAARARGRILTPQGQPARS